MRNFLDKLPPLSPTLTMLIASLSREDVSFAKISELIEKDPVLAGNVLGLVNSSLLERRGRVSSVRHAVSLLGVDKIRNSALSMSITRMWDKMRTPPGWSTAKFNKHALAVAMLADILSQEFPLNYPEGAFIAGLLHDLGKLMIAMCMPREYGEIEELITETGRPPVECELEILGVTHADLSGEAMQAWNMPKAIEAAVRYHHSPDLDPTPGAPRSLALSFAIATADEYVNQQGWDAGGYASSGEPASLFPIEALGSAEVQRLLDQFHREFESLSAFV
jgi:HD-like signal output (HDOD) protein